MRLPDVSKELFSHADDSETQSEETDVEGGRETEGRKEDEEEIDRQRFSGRDNPGRGFGGRPPNSSASGSGTNPWWVRCPAVFLSRGLARGL